MKCISIALFSMAIIQILTPPVIAYEQDSSSFEPEGVEVVNRLKVEVVDTRNDKTIDELVKQYKRVKQLEELIKNAIHHTSKLQHQFNISKEQQEQQLKKFQSEVRKAIGDMRMVSIRMYDSGEMVKFSSNIIEVMDVSNDAFLKSTLEVLDYLFNVSIGTLITLSVLELNSNSHKNAIEAQFSTQNNPFLQTIQNPTVLQLTSAATMASLKLPVMNAIKNLRGNLTINKAFGNLASQFGGPYKETNQQSFEQYDKLRTFYDNVKHQDYTRWVPTDRELEEFNSYIQVYKEYSNHYNEILTTTNYLLSIESDKKVALEKLKTKAARNYEKSLKLIRLAEGYYSFLKGNKFVLGN